MTDDERAAVDEILSLPSGEWEAFAGWPSTEAYAAAMQEAAAHNARCRQPRAEPKRRRRDDAEAAGVLLWD